MKIKTGKKQGPPSLARVESLSGVEVLQVFMVRPNLEWDWCSLQPLPPLLNGKLNCQQLLVPDIIIPLGWGQPVQIKRTRVYLGVPSRALGQYGPHPGVGGVHLHYELPLGVWMNQDGGRHETPLEAPESLLGLRSPGEPRLGGSQAGESCGDGAVVPDEPPIKIAEPQEPLEGLPSVGVGHCSTTPTFSGSMVEGGRGTGELALLRLDE